MKSRKLLSLSNEAPRTVRTGESNKREKEGLPCRDLPHTWFVSLETVVRVGAFNANYCENTSKNSRNNISCEMLFSLTSQELKAESLQENFNWKTFPDFVFVWGGKKRETEGRLRFFFRWGMTSCGRPWWGAWSEDGIPRKGNVWELKRGLWSCVAMNFY